jgi:hypothetical protein
LIKQNHVVHLLLLLSLAPFLHIKPQQIRTRKNTTPAMSLTPNHQYQNSLTKSSLFFSYAITPTKENHSRLKTLNNKKKKEPVICCTFFFCLPPPDFAGFEDGGGAFSFFGAYK